MKQISFVLLFVANCNSFQIIAQSQILSDCAISFSIKSFGYGNIKGAFQAIENIVEWNSENINKSNFFLQIKSASVDTGKDLVNKFIKGDAFFASDQYEKITFQSTTISKSGNTYWIKGQLNIKGQTKTIIIPCEIEEKGTAVLLNGKLEINRFDFGLGENYNSFLIKENVEIEIKAKFSKTANDIEAYALK